MLHPGGGAQNYWYSVQYKHSTITGTGIVHPQQSRMPWKGQQHSLLMPYSRSYRWELMHRHKKTKMQGWTSNLRKLRYSMVPNHPNVTHGWKRYTPCVSKQEGLSAKCCYYVQVKLSMTSSWTCPLMQRMIKTRMISLLGIWIYKD